MNIDKLIEKAKQIGFDEIPKSIPSVFLREIDVENIVRKNLQKNGFSVIPRIKPQGIDVVARKNGVPYYIEVEGNKKPKVNLPLTTSQKYTHYFRAIGQLAYRISEYGEGVFVLALPEDEYYREKVRKTLPAFRKLGVVVYFVTTSGLEVIE